MGAETDARATGGERAALASSESESYQEMLWAAVRSGQEGWLWVAAAEAQNVGATRTGVRRGGQPPAVPALSVGRWGTARPWGHCVHGYWAGREPGFRSVEKRCLTLIQCIIAG